MDTVVLIRIIAGLLFVVVLIPVLLVPYWMIFKKAGFSPWLALLMWVPFVNLVVLYVVAFSNWRIAAAPGPGVYAATSSVGVVQPRRTPVWVWVLVGLAAGFPVLLILMLMAIPTIGVMKIHANEVSAINAMQAITKAEIMYETSYPANGYACSLTALGGDPASGPPSPTSAQLIQADLASGYKSGYIFAVTNCTKATVAGTDRITGFEVTAVPEVVGKTGDRGFCTDQNDGSPRYDPAGGTNCTQPLQ